MTGKRPTRCLLVCSLLLLVTACAGPPYFSIPRKAAVASLEAKRDWPNQVVAGYPRKALIDDGVLGLEAWGWGPRKLTESADPVSTCKGCYLEFLHLSDAQVRDTKIIRRSDYVLYDVLAPFSSTLRYELIEDLDSVLLAAMLRGYRIMLADHPNRRASTFAVHTGDLLDLSLVTEMLDASAAIRYAVKAQRDGETSTGGLWELPFVSVSGNHDGLTFGVIGDQNSTTWELGLNRLEFHLASQLLLKDLRPAASTASNEAEDGLLKGSVASIAGAPVFSARVKENHDRFQSPGSATGLRSSPVALKGVVNTPSKEDDALQPAYLSFVRNGFRVLVLDTRSTETHQGCVGQVQLGWLYNELAYAYGRQQPVVVFAHHHPDDLALGCVSASYKRLGHTGPLKRMLFAFPNVLGYFYGHAHERRAAIKGSKDNQILFAQAPSLVDYPQGALWVRISRANGADSYSIAVDSVKVKPNRKNEVGQILAGLQDTAFIYAWHDARHSGTNPEANCEPQYGDLRREAEHCSERGFYRGTYPIPVHWESAGGTPSAEKAIGSKQLVCGIVKARETLLGRNTPLSGIDYLSLSIGDACASNQNLCTNSNLHDEGRIPCF